MKRSTMPRATKPMRNVSAKKRRERTSGRTDVAYGAYFEHVKAQGRCVLRNHPAHRCHGPLDAHHVVFVSQGGKDEANLIPLCRRAHDRMHALGSHALFDAEWSIKSEELARAEWESYAGGAW